MIYSKPEFGLMDSQKFISNDEFLYYFNSFYTSTLNYVLIFVYVSDPVNHWMLLILDLVKDRSLWFI